MSNNGPVRVAEDGAGYQFSPFGILPIGTSIAPTSDDAAPAAVPQSQMPAPSSALAPFVPPVPVADPRITPAELKPLIDLKATVSSSPREVIRAARARVKELKQELRVLAARKRELEELERLLRAAKQRPEPKVRALRAG